VVRLKLNLEFTIKIQDIVLEEIGNLRNKLSEIESFPFVDIKFLPLKQKLT